MRVLSITRPQTTGVGAELPRVGLGGPCPLGMVLTNGRCVPMTCPPGTVLTTYGNCVAISAPPPGKVCLPGSAWTRTGPTGPGCVWNAAYGACPPGTTWDNTLFDVGAANGGCVCPPGTYWVSAPGDLTGRNGSCQPTNIPPPVLPGQATRHAPAPLPPLPPGVQRPLPPLPPARPAPPVQSNFPAGFNPFSGQNVPARAPAPVQTHAAAAPARVRIAGLPAGAGGRHQLNPQLG